MFPLQALKNCPTIVRAGCFLHTHVHTHRPSLFLFQQELCIAMQKCLHVHMPLAKASSSCKLCCLLQRTAIQMLLRCQGCISMTLLAWPRWDIYPRYPSTNVMDFLPWQGASFESMWGLNVSLSCWDPQQTFSILSSLLETGDRSCRFNSCSNGSGSTGLVTETIMLLIISLLTPTASNYTLVCTFRNLSGVRNVSLFNLRSRAVERIALVPCLRKKSWRRVGKPSPGLTPSGWTSIAPSQVEMLHISSHSWRRWHIQKP